MINERIEDILYLIDELLNDRSIPRNVRELINQAKQLIENKNVDNYDTNLVKAINYLDEAVNDMNLPDHARTEIWNLVAEIQELIEEIRKNS